MWQILRFLKLILELCFNLTIKYEKTENKEARFNLCKGYLNIALFGVTVSFRKNSNNFIFLKKNKKTKRIIHINGLKIRFKGQNNKIIVGKNCKFKDSVIEFWGDNVTIEIGKNCVFNSLKSICAGSEEGNKIIIGDNFFSTDRVQFYAGGGSNNDIKIGDNCLFSRDITIYAHDGHNIYDLQTNEIINKSKHNLVIGNNVWLGHGVIVIKNSVIPNNTIVGAKSIVSGVFEEENTILAGHPAKKIKSNIYWEK